MCTKNEIRVCVIVVFFFFFKQMTAYDMRISDWSSDVCSSDLIVLAGMVAPVGGRPRNLWHGYRLHENKVECARTPREPPRHPAQQHGSVSGESRRRDVP